MVLDPLIAYLDENGIGRGDAAVEPIGDGHSNPTYLVSRTGAQVVVRRPPRPPFPPSAHDVLREARVLKGVAGSARVPEVLAVCDDKSVIGAPFYVMQRISGEVITTEIPAALNTPAQCRRVAEELVDALAEVHAVDWRAAGLGSLGKPQGYLERQLQRFRGLWEHNRTREIAAVERVARWLAEHLPDSGPATIVHGDYRLGNTIYAPDPPARLLAIFDWEMSTLGDPLADVGYLCALWSEPGDPEDLLLDHVGNATRAEGFLTRAELVERYEATAARPVSNLNWYMTFAVWKAIVFMEGNYRRALAGATDDPYLKGFGDGVLRLAQRAEMLAGRQPGS
jgi:aminoglycoside phosphotransferase (APT) family kinase protein